MYVISKEINESLPSLEIVCFSHSEKPIGVSEYTKIQNYLLLEMYPLHYKKHLNI